MICRPIHLPKISALLTGASLLLVAAVAVAEPTAAVNVLAGQAALQGVGNGLPIDAIQTATAAQGYDWTLGIALGLGIIGLVWMRRHIANL